MSGAEVPFVGPMAEAMMGALVRLPVEARRTPLAELAVKSMWRTRVKKVRAWDTRLSFKTFQALNREGTLP